MTRIYRYDTGEIEDIPDYQSGLLEKLYGRFWGRCLQTLLTWPPVSELLVIKDRLPLSKQKVDRFVETYQIDLSEYEKAEFATFAEFFTRTPKLSRRPLCQEPAIMAVADAKLRVLSIDRRGRFLVKGQFYKLEQLLQDASLASQFEGGSLFLYRLGVEDVHRYLYAETGKILQQNRIPGRLHSIRDMVQEKLPVFKENRRAYAVYETEHGLVLQMEVGALLVGAIHNHSSHYAIRGQEKGYFSLGGSSILVLYQKDQVVVDPLIQKYSDQNIEVQVQMGQAIAYKKEKEKCYQD